MKAGGDYDKLPDMWTIWILPYDPFGLDYRIYTVKNVVEEIVKQKMEEMKSVMDAAKQEVDAAKQEVDKMKKLTQVLLDAERFDDLRRITTDEAYLKKCRRSLGFNIDAKSTGCRPI